ncbi:MAG: DUF4340 domain-containing protein [Calothrix sp. SM1_7_51]|nr:DUF4340 domain-containing protein [Calothrix sp. SM1_7_51]
MILILLALSLGGFVYFYEIQGKTQREEVEEKNKQIFSFTADDVQALTITTNNTTISLERNSNNDDQATKWLLKSPELAPASNASVSYLMDLLVDGKTNRTLSALANQISEYGLDKPQATIEVKLKNQKSHQLVLGKQDFNQRFIYARADSITKPDGNIDILLLSTDFLNGVNRDLSEWKQSSENKLNQANPNTPQSTPLPIPTFAPSPP